MDYLVPSAESSDRVLASVRRVHSVVKHPDADKLSLLSISTLGDPTQACGWQMVINHEQNMVQPGELVIYVEVDAVLPMTNPAFKFMEPHKGRVKTIKLRGKISQGLLFPLTLVPDRELKEGDDLTEHLKIRKFVPPEERELYTMGGSSLAWGTFPSTMCHRTEEVRIQNLNLADWADAAKDVVITEKLHGTSATFIFGGDGKIEYVCSRNLIRSEDDSVWWVIAHKIQKTMEDEKVAEAFKVHCPVVIQGEICGPNINGNMYKLPQPDLFVFTTTGLTRVEGGVKRLFDRHARAKTDEIAQILKLKTVPIVEAHVDLSGCTPKEILERYSEGPSLLNPKVKQREGVVGRSNLKYGPDFSFKALNNRLL